MIDIHCHILYDMDDGANDIHESIALAANAMENNIDVIVATPHFFDYDRIDDFVAERDAQIQSLTKILEKRKTKTLLAKGAEVFLDSRVFVADSLNELTINSSDYLLCEFALEAFDLEYAIVMAEEIINRGHKLIIAHPERYVSFFEKPSIMNELYEMGAYFQVNATSLAGYGGEAMQMFSMEMIEKGFVDFIATDAHSIIKRNNSILQKIKDFPIELTNEQLDYMLTKAPLMVLKNEAVPRRKIIEF